MKTLPVLKIATIVVSLAFAGGVTAQTTESSAASAPSGSSESLGQHISDGTITTKAKAALMAAKDVKSTRIHVKTRRGTVWLTGSVPTSDEKSRAQEVVEGIDGVHQVKNRLKVRAAGTKE
ncbi:BON domain-containing protein [Trinickia soli]|uniref:Transporter n=1 Tax=Trinickia soli TaxID=380675 RepID=A0A2N7W0B7_9BURK|nr:BON domain-containing protein [Trinickia soli]PMS22856.1 transporter [Trinickia soli]CAB3683620.1 Osmotically-inducible protein Y [Trinickia soli]